MSDLRKLAAVAIAAPKEEKLQNQIHIIETITMASYSYD